MKKKFPYYQQFKDKVSKQRIRATLYQYSCFIKVFRDVRRIKCWALDPKVEEQISVGGSYSNWSKKLRKIESQVFKLLYMLVTCGIAQN